MIRKYNQLHIRNYLSGTRERICYTLRIKYVFLLFAFLMASCGMLRQGGPAAGGQPKALRTVYKTVDTSLLYMDIYRPETAKETVPAMVFFFGGGWSGGSTTQFEPHARYFSRRGLACFLVDYRVRKRQGTTPFESLKDAKSAIRYIKEHADEFGIDTAKIIAAGGSAGGHLAAAAALTQGFNEESDHLGYSARPAALVLFNPVIDNGPDGYGYDRVQERYKEFSPMHNIREGAPPTILFLGTEDHLIPVETAREYQRKMKEVGSRCELRLYEEQGHGFFNYKHRENYRKTIYEADRFLVSLGLLDKDAEVHEP